MPTPDPNKLPPRQNLHEPRSAIGGQRLAKDSVRERVVPTFSKSFLSFLSEIVKVVLISVAIIVPIRYFLIQPFYVKGASMEPTFHDNEYLIIDEISYRFRQPQRGEVVVLKNPRGESDFYIKRVIGLPGEHVVIRNGEVLVFNDVYPSGAVLDESAYLEASVRTTGDIDFILRDDEYFILGDNRRASLDSRSFGPIKKSEIVGRTWVRAWPLNKLRVFQHPQYQLTTP